MKTFALYFRVYTVVELYMTFNFSLCSCVGFILCNVLLTLVHKEFKTLKLMKAKKMF